jgi:hypothetical protein
MFFVPTKNPIEFLYVLFPQKNQNSLQEKVGLKVLRSLIGGRVPPPAQGRLSP